MELFFFFRNFAHSKEPYHNPMTTKEMSQKYHVGIALSGGGVRGFAHIGALRALEDMGIVPQALAGVSAGSVVAAFYAAGLKADEIYRTMNDADLKSFIQVDLSGAAIATGYHFR